MRLASGLHATPTPAMQAMHIDDLLLPAEILLIVQQLQLVHQNLHAHIWCRCDLQCIPPCMLVSMLNWGPRARDGDDLLHSAPPAIFLLTWAPGEQGLRLALFPHPGLDLGPCQLVVELQSACPS